MFDEALSKAELSIEQSIKSVATNVKGNHRSMDYKKKIDEPRKSFRQLGHECQTALSATTLRLFS